jgi:methylmalonyl-CoA mutase, N-terminal domain
MPSTEAPLTTSGIPLKPIYTEADLGDWDPETQLGESGSFPFTRGIHPEMYRRRPWTFRQYAGYGDAAATNERFRFLLDRGQTGLSLAFDLPTQLGLDSDDPEAVGEVGRLGVAIDTVDDMMTVYDGIPLDETSTSMTINATAAVILAMYVAIADERGISRSVLSGTVQNDIFKEYLARGLYLYPPTPSLRLTGDVVEFCVRELPRFNPISVSAPHIRSAGARYVDALAYMFLAAKLVLADVKRRGLEVDAVASRISFLAGVDNDFFESICRHRASRRLWARIMAQEFGAEDPRARQYRLAGSGNPLNLTYQQPLNNIARITLQGLANVLGGCQSLVLPCWDEAFTIPTEAAVETSLNIQRILAFETGVTNVVDPLAGSYFIESLTDTVESEIVSKMAEIEGRGGLIAAIEDGSIAREMAAHAYELERAIQEGRTTVVGVNKFTSEMDAAALESTMHVHDPLTAESQIRRLSTVRAQRDGGRVQSALRRLHEACEGTENVMEPLLDAVKARATIGEMNSTMLTAFGSYRAPDSP